MEDTVKDAILTGTTQDAVLAGIIELTVSSILEGRPLYPNLRDEPVFYRRHFKKWVQEGLAELKAASAENDRA